MGIIHDFAQNLKAHDFKAAAQMKLHQANEWVQAHRDEVITFGPVVVAGSVALIKGTVRSVNLHRQESLRNLYCYDRSLGHYWRLKRKLSNREWIAIEARRKSGERLADILNSMNVLK